MSRSLSVYTHRGDGHTVVASEVTPADLEKGMGGAVGDFYVHVPGHRGAQWWERDTFNDQYERSHQRHSDDELEPVLEVARDAIDALEPKGNPAEQLTRDTFADQGLPTSAAALEFRVQTIEARLGALDSLESRDRDLLARIEALELRVEVVETLGTQNAGEVQELGQQLAEVSSKLSGKKR